MRRLLFLSLTLGALLSGCTSGGGDDDDDGTPRTVFGTEERPAEIVLPAAYDPAQEWPLVMLVHAYSVNGTIQAGYLGINAIADSKGALFIAPDGTTNEFGDGFWEATDACCGFGTGPDDAGYLRGILEGIIEDYNVDRSRVFLIGHSNGAFMSHRMACESSDLITGVVTLAGMTWLDPADCGTPSNDVSVLQIHGDLDDTILYAGGEVDPAAPSYPSAVETVTRWQGYDDCTPGLVLDPTRLDLIADVDGAETKVERFTCPGTTGVELWTMEGGPHIPTFLDFQNDVWEWLDAHPRP